MGYNTEFVESSCAFDDDSREHRRDSCSNGTGNESKTDLRGGVALGFEEEGEVEYHCEAGGRGESIGETAAGDGEAAEEGEGDDGFFCVVEFGDYENYEGCQGEWETD